MRAFVAALLLSGLLAGPAWAGFESGMSAYRSGDFAAARDAFTALAKTGDAKAQAALGILYARGEGVDKDLGEARKWFTAAAKQGYAPAQYQLGRMVYAGVAGDKDLKQAADWFTKAADQGHVMAAERLSELYYSGEGVARNYELSAKYARHAAEFGHPAAQYHLGSLYMHGQGVPKDEVEAYYWVFLAAQRGMIEAQQVMIGLSQQLTAEQMMSAERRATKWRPKRPPEE